jgi:hypothetical protein
MKHNSPARPRFPGTRRLFCRSTFLSGLSMPCLAGRKCLGTIPTCKFVSLHIPTGFRVLLWLQIIIELALWLQSLKTISQKWVGVWREAHTYQRLILCSTVWRISRSTDLTGRYNWCAITLTEWVMVAKF